MASVTSANENRKSRAARWLPLACLAAGFVAFFALGLHDYLSLRTLKHNRAELLDWVSARPFLAPLVYILAYAAVVSFSLPGGAVLTITGGFLFGTVFGCAYAVIGATIGAVVVFLAARTALGDALRAKAGGAIKRMEEGFREDAFNYLLVLRLVPLFPFFIVNLVPAFLGVGLGVYAAATLLGIIPGALVYASVGSGVGAVFDAGDKPDLGILFKPKILLPIIGLCVLALVPVAYKRLKKK
ncbi:MAG TPA: TVP38/TMEM64 family protein [Alphaproteobacteria bacterium]|nr:TVP38/TMEM64 family protein [Alphaproteobacteria bacterium]